MNIIVDIIYKGICSVQGACNSEHDLKLNNSATNVTSIRGCSAIITYDWILIS